VIYFSQTSIGLFNPNTKNWTTVAINGVYKAKFGLGNFRYEAFFMQTGTKVYEIRVSNKILTPAEIMARNAIDIERFGTGVKCCV